jgi:hypothetical protein
MSERIEGADARSSYCIEGRMLYKSNPSEPRQLRRRRPENTNPDEAENFPQSILASAVGGTISHLILKSPQPVS